MKVKEGRGKGEEEKQKDRSNWRRRGNRKGRIREGEEIKKG